MSITIRRRQALRFSAFVILIFVLYPWYNIITSDPDKVNNISTTKTSKTHNPLRSGKSHIRRRGRHISKTFKSTRHFTEPFRSKKTKRNTIVYTVGKLEEIDQHALSKKLPKLTQKAQGPYYGKGCGINRNKKRLQILLHVWEAIAARRNITRYFLCYGSVLGSERNEDIIPYDSDIDVCMLRQDYPKLFPEESQRPLDLNDVGIHLLLQKHSPNPDPKIPRKDCRGILRRKKVDSCSILDPHGRLFSRNRKFLDIFLIEDYGANVWDEYKNKILPRDLIFPVIQCRFLGLETMCPSDVERYLSLYYGYNFMKPHYVCKNGKWVKNTADARKKMI